MDDMKRTKIYFLMAAVLLMGCSTIDDAADPNCRKAVVLTASASDATATQVGMRAADGLYESTTGFDGGEQVQLYLHNASYPTVIPTGTYSVGTPDATYKKSALTYASGTELLYPVEQSNSGSPAFTLYGVYPATSTASHTVSYDQTNTEDGTANYKKSDLMYATTGLTWTSASDKEVARNLLFNHQLSKLKLTIVKAKEVGQIYEVSMKGVKRQVSVSPTYTTAGVGAAASVEVTELDPYGDNILLSEGEEASDAQQTYTYCCLFPPQTWDDAAFITIYADGGQATFKTTKTFEGGHEYQLTIQLTAVTADFTATIENWPEGDALPEDTLIY